ncbi:MAG TPA: heavy metal-binding domain-containing protein [Lutibacter sp.]
MKTKILIALLSIGLFTVSTVKAQEKAKIKVEHLEKIAFACPMQCEGEKTYDKPGSCPKCKMDLKKEEMKMAEMYVCPMHADIKSVKPGACTKCGMDLKKAEMKMDHTKMNHDKMDKTYSCPMHADIKSDKPGSCSKCGMALKEKKMDMKKVE